MPFRSAQAVVKKIFPNQFDSIYQKACNAYDVYAKVRDNTFYIPSYVWYKISGQKEKARRIEIVQKVLGHTMVSLLGVLATYDIVFKAKELQGVFVECGVARGGCSALMALIARDEGKGRETFMFDSFEGLPPQTDKDGKQKSIRHKNRRANDLAEGYCLGTLPEVSDWFRSIFGDNPDVIMVKGWFDKSLPQSRNIVGDIAVLRLDSDWYESTKCCLENLYSNVVKGGYVIIDDYQLSGCKLAVDEFLAKQNPIPIMEYDANGRAYWRKS